MWQNRFDDLWVWPMPDWFVHTCNRIGGTWVLDAITGLGLVGVIALGVGYWSESIAWTWIGGGLASPAVLLFGLMMVTAQVRARRRYREHVRKARAEAVRDVAHRAASVVDYARLPRYPG